ncbi:MAG TPA: hypothetical protein VE690_17175, partial [Rhodopila sp.]|nr:hypothetical protein [Rhodopila sp.]
MMPGADTVSTHLRYAARTGSWPTDLIIAAVFIAVYALVIHAFQYQGALGESDLYRVLVGIMAGADSGDGLATDLHYDRDFGFGYLAAFYAFADPATLRDPDRLMALMSQVGFWSALAGLALFWCAVRLVHGSLTANVALIVFALAPIIPELATSGHQVLPMFAFLCAAAVLMFLPLTGWRAALAGVAAWALLLLGMTMRGEEFLAFPWLVLARADTTSFRRFIISALLRSIAPALAIVGWAVLQRIVLPAASNEMGSTISLYFTEFYRWRTIAPGVVYMMTGCGFATVAVAAGAVVYLGWQELAGRRIAPAAGLGAWLGPAALVLVPFLFFVPNPQPTRHFMLTLAGLGIFIGMACARFPRAGRATAVVAALCIGAANQVFAELVRPPLLRIN